MRAFSRTVVIALLALIATSLVSLQVLRVNGPLYHRIVLGKDLIADVLPPPEYVLESYLEATLALKDPGQSAVHLERLTSLKSDYDQRHTYWATAGLPADLRQKIEVDSDLPAQAFWNEIDQSFAPALRRGDQAAAEASYGRIVKAYAEHRAAVDALVAASTAENAKAEQLAVVALVIFASLVLAVGLGLIVLVRRRAAQIALDVIDPLSEITRAMAALSGGTEDLTIPHTARTDEVGEMARALAVFQNQAAEGRNLRRDRAADRAQQDSERIRVADEQGQVVDSVARALATLADGDLSVRLHRAFPGGYDRLREDFNRAATQLDAALNVVRRNTDAIQSQVGQIARANTDLAARTLEQAGNVEQTGRTLQGIAEAVRASARATAQASDAVLAAKVDAERSDGVIAETVLAMNEIVGSTREIEQVVEVIDGIAFQTNLLALNAGVEAARAGDFGRGFAVVATEVRALAQHSAARAKDINALIQKSSSQVDTGMRYVTGTGETLRRIVVQVGDLAEFVGRIAEATQEQAGRLGAVNVASDQLETATQQNARMAEECTQAVESLHEQAVQLSEVVGGFRLSDDQAGPPATVEIVTSGLQSPERQAAGHILIVDDNAINRTVASTMCQMFGCTTEAVDNGEAGVQAARSGRFDLILMDIMMPGMGGTAAIQAIRRLPGAPGQTPIIAVTANALEESVRANRAAGATAIVEKPLATHDLLAAIKDALGEHPAQSPTGRRRSA